MFLGIFLTLWQQSSRFRLGLRWEWLEGSQVVKDEELRHLGSFPIIYFGCLKVWIVCRQGRVGIKEGVMREG